MSSSDNFFSALSFAPGELGQMYTGSTPTAHHPHPVSAVSSANSPTPTVTTSPSLTKVFPPPSQSHAVKFQFFDRYPRFYRNILCRQQSNTRSGQCPTSHSCQPRTAWCPPYWVTTTGEDKRGNESQEIQTITRTEGGSAVSRKGI